MMTPAKRVDVTRCAYRLGLISKGVAIEVIRAHVDVTPSGAEEILTNPMSYEQRFMQGIK